MMAEAMPLFIKRFWTEYKDELRRVEYKDNDGKTRERFEPTGNMRGVDWVEYSPLGSIQKTSLKEAISRLSAVVPIEGRAAMNPAVQMAHMRWNAIKPHYEAWKAGQAAPVDGTPLSVWNGVSKEQAEVFRMKGVLTVEHVAQLTDTHKQSMGIPGLHEIVDNAKRFLTAQDKGAVAKALAQKDAEIDSLKEQMAELAKLTQDLIAQKSEAAEPKKRGRPAKAEAEAAA